VDIVVTIVQNFAAFVVVLSVLVFIHEYGHYLGCKICHVKVDSFSIGIGREICGWTNKNGVRWKISWLPFGGYLKMFGDDDFSSGKADKDIIKNVSDSEKKEIFYFKSPYERFLVVFMGPFFNLMFAVLLLTALTRYEGVKTIRPIIDSVLDNSPAKIAGLIVGDEVVSIDGKGVKTFNDVTNIIALHNLSPIKLEVKRGEKHLVIDITPTTIKTKDMFGNTVETTGIGVASLVQKNSTLKQVGIFEAFIEANKDVYSICKNTLIVLKQILTGNRGMESLGGPVKIAKYSAQSFSKGIRTVIYFMAMISANLGLMNLLPIPVLDGGHLLFFLVEMLVRRPIPEKIQERLLQGGFAILIAMMTIATFNDIATIAQ